MNRHFCVFLVCLAASLFSCKKQENSHNVKVDSSLHALSLSSRKSFEAYSFSEMQQSAIVSLLRDSMLWRLALDSDNISPFLKDQQGDHPGYRPYYLEADIDRNGEQDFVLALFNEEDKIFSVYLFRQLDKTYTLPALVFSSQHLQQSGFCFIRGDLVVGEFYSDNAGVFRWDDREGRLLEIEFEVE
ncbi:MAG: hypothetical protein FJ215_12630 [Ignavibacteria bacterium]|nr:hypothetical protein [Ignavibacteria bacterium]